MERATAIARLQQLVGKELHILAREYGVTVVGPSGKTNKGWAGHVFEL